MFSEVRNHEDFNRYRVAVRRHSRETCFYLAARLDGIEIFEQDLISFDLRRQDYRGFGAANAPFRLAAQRRQMIAQSSPNKR